MRQVLVRALCACCDRNLRRELRQFLEGLSSDELQFIAGFVGTWVLESTGGLGCHAPEPSGLFLHYAESALGTVSEARADREHKMILLLEYICRGGLGSRTHVTAA